MNNKHKCQNNETQIVIDWFTKKHRAGFVGNVLDIGANDGVTFSNSFDLIQSGWSGWLVEPSSAFNELIDIYGDSKDIQCLNVAIGQTAGTMTLYESGAHVKGGRDKALVSTLVRHEMSRWCDVDFTPIDVKVITFDMFYEAINKPKNIHYLSIDVEGVEMDILKQIDLRAIGCEVLCIEYNGRSVVGNMFTNYCAKYGMKEIHRNAENLIFAKI